MAALTRGAGEHSDLHRCLTTNIAGLTTGGWELIRTKASRGPSLRLCNRPRRRRSTAAFAARAGSNIRCSWSRRSISVWILVAAYTILTRVAALSTRPMFPGEASRALGEFALAVGIPYPAAAARALGWIGFAQIGIFHAIGASDMSARGVAALGALLMLCAAFALRGAIGRAGALALAAMFAISPTLLYVSSFGTTASAAIGLVMIAVALAIAMVPRPTATRAAALAIVLALAISAGPVGAIDVLTAILALGIVGVINAIAGGNTVLRIRVWWTRRGWLLVAGAIAFIAVWIVLVEILSTDGLRVPFAAMFAPLANAMRWSAPSTPRSSWRSAGFYEFAIVLAALAGVISIIARRIKSYFAGWCLVWMLVSIAVWTIARPYRAEFALGFIVPMALLGAWGIQCLHELEVWGIVRYPAAAIAILAIYAQFVTSAVIAAPNASQAQWERRGSLLWNGPATTIQTDVECARNENGRPRRDHRDSGRRAGNCVVFARARAGCRTRQHNHRRDAACFRRSGRYGKQFSVWIRRKLDARFQQAHASGRRAFHADRACVERGRDSRPRDRGAPTAERRCDARGGIRAVTDSIRDADAHPDGRHDAECVADADRVGECIAVGSSPK